MNAGSSVIFVTGVFAKKITTEFDEAVDKLDDMVKKSTAKYPPEK